MSDEKRTHRTVSIYIPETMIREWEEIVKAANDEQRGVGYYICDKLSKLKK